MTINKDFQTKSDQELIDIVKKLRIKLLEYRFKNATGEFDKPHQIRFARKSLAQALTILRKRNIKIAHLQLDKLNTLNSEKSFFKATKENATTSATKQESEDKK